MAWLSSPRISAMWRATGSTSVRNPSRRRSRHGPESTPRARQPPRRAPRPARASARALPRCRRAHRPAAASAIRCLARSSARGSMRAEATLRAGWTLPSSTTTFHRSSSRSIRPSRVMPRGSSSTGGPRARSSTGTFSELPDLVGDLLVVVNDTKVVPARLRLRRSSGAAIEVLLVESLDDGRWEALARPSRRLRAGEQLGPVLLVEPLGGGR